MDWNEMLPWGLTIAQTGFLCCGGLVLMGGWVMVKNMMGAAKSALLMGLAMLMGCLFLATLGFYLFNA